MTEEQRAYCYGCAKPQEFCLCTRVARVDNRTGVQILQHCKERHHPLGTARLIRLGFHEVGLHVLHKNHPDGSSRAVSLPEGSALLYPAPDALDLETLSPEDQPKHLVVLDGTWWQAHQMYRDNDWIRALPHVRIQPLEPSRYRIRREPREECVSSLEAVIGALRIMEPGLDGLDGLIASFESMIDDQIKASQGPDRTARTKRVRRGRPRAIPWPIIDTPERVVVVYAEAAHGPLRRNELRDTLQLTAVRLTTGEVFEAMVRTDPVPDPGFLVLLDLEPEDLADAQPLDEVASAFAAFCGEDPVLTAWNGGSIRLLRPLGVDVSKAVVLKGVWANLTRSGVPALYQLVADEGLEVNPLPCRGRARFRLAQGVTVLQHMVERANAQLAAE